jgi:integrase
MKRRSAGNYVDLGEGKYRLRYKGRSKNVTASSPRDLEKQLSSFVSEVDKGQLTPQNITFEKAAEKWMQHIVSDYEPRTRKYYREMLDGRILKKLGTKKLDQITPFMLQEFFTEMRQEVIQCKNTSRTLSDSSIKHHFAVVRSVFEACITWELYNKSNPCRGVKLGKSKKQQPKFYDDKQIRLLLDALDKEEIMFKTGVILAIDTGCRMGELCGWQWDDVNWKNKTLSVERQAQYISGTGIFDKLPKTDNSYRTIDLSGSTMKLLEIYKTDQQNKGFLCSGQAKVFVNYDGTTRYPYWLTNAFPAFLKRHGLPPITPHGLRHSHGSYLLDQGMNVKEVGERLGHGSVSSTNIYCHGYENSGKKAAEKIEKLHKKGQTLDITLDTNTSTSIQK